MMSPPTEPRPDSLFAPFRGCPAENFSHVVLDNGLEVFRNIFFLVFYFVLQFWLIRFFVTPALMGKGGDGGMKKIIPRLPRSSVESENDPVFVSWCLSTLLQSLIVPTICLVALFGPDHVRDQWGGWGDGETMPLGWIPPPEVRKNRFGSHHLVIVAGWLFIAFEAADVIIMFYCRFLPGAFLVHHFIYIIIGVLMAGDCCFQFYAAVLMAQEVSNPFLNLGGLLLNRMDERAVQVGR